MPKMSALELMTPVAMALPPGDYSRARPLHVTSGEGADIAGFVLKYYSTLRDPKTKEVTRPGLDTLGDRFPSTTSTELLTLVDAVDQATHQYQTKAGLSAASPMARAHFVLGELKSVLEYHFDDGVEDDNDARLAAVARSHDSAAESADAVASELADYVALAKLHRKDIDGLGGFDVNLLDEGTQLVKALRDRPATPVANPAQRDALELRNRLAWLLDRKVAEVRAAARFVFRSYPEIIREATSVYDRRRRAAQRREKARKEGLIPKDPGTNE